MSLFSKQTTLISFANPHNSSSSPSFSLSQNFLLQLWMLILDMELDRIGVTDLDCESRITSLISLELFHYNKKRVYIRPKFVCNLNLHMDYVWKKFVCKTLVGNTYIRISKSVGNFLLINLYAIFVCNYIWISFLGNYIQIWFLGNYIQMVCR